MKTAFSYFLQPMRQSFDFTGRANRTQYWLFVLWEIILIILWAVLVITLETQLKNAFGVTAAFSLPLFALAILALIPANIAIRCRRLHDIDMSGWWQLLILIPSLGGIIVLIFMLISGTKGENSFGPVPKL